MKKLTKIISLIVIIAILLQNAIVLANVIEIGDKSLIKRGELGFYTIQYWNEAKQRWMYITYSQTYYIDKNGNSRIAYCVDPELDGVGWLPGEAEEYEATISNKIENVALWNVYKNGYPFVSYSELGVETQEDAYLATKQAAYFVIRNWPLSKVYDYFRAGEDPINNQDMEKTNQRGKKVVDAIYKLVDEAYNNTKKMPSISIKSISDFMQDGNEQYYSKKYLLEKTNSELVLKIKQIKDAPKGTFISDENGKEKDTFNGGEQIKIMVPKDKIDKKYDIKINYETSLKNYPVYYAKSENENCQNYVIIGDINEKTNNQLTAKINEGRSSLNITKIDEETKQPISGVKFNIKYKSGETIGEFTTNENGKINVKNIHPGVLVIKETQSNQDYEINIEEKELKIGYNATYNIEITNKRKKGSLEIIKVDKDENNKKIQGVEFDLIDTQGNLIKHLITDKEGKAIANDINCGNYILKEIKTNEEYRLGKEHNIKIKWNEKLTLTIENEKQKGQIQIIKTSADDNKLVGLPQGSNLEGVKFKIYDANDNQIEEIETDKQGKAISSMLPRGLYKVKESKANDWYIIDESKYEVNITKDNEIVELNLTNKSKNPDVDIIKRGPNMAYSNQEIKYDFEIKNTGNVSLNKFTWYDFLPYEYSNITKIATGTYNQELKYNAYYKTNKKEEYMVLKENLSTKQNNYIDLTKIYLEEDEKITQIKFEYGNVDINFKSEEKPNIYVKLNENLQENQELKNTTILEGLHNNYKVCDEDETITIIKIKNPEPKKLPRTGF